MLPIMPPRVPKTPSNSQLSISWVSWHIGIKHLRQGDFFLEKLKV